MLASGVGRGVALNNFLLRKLPIRPLTSFKSHGSLFCFTGQSIINRVDAAPVHSSAYITKKNNSKPAFSFSSSSHPPVLSARSVFSALVALPLCAPAGPGPLSAKAPHIQASRSMATFNQIVKRNLRSGKGKNKPRSPNLHGNPQKKGIVQKVFAMAPKKPNSASRKVVSVLLAMKKKTEIHCHIPGVKHALQQFSSVLVRGGRAKDLPGVKYRLVRGKFDLKRVFDRFKARSKYGIKKNN